MTRLLRSMLPHFTQGNVFVCSRSEEKAFLMDGLQWGRTLCVMATDKFQPKKECQEVPLQCQSVIYHSDSAVPIHPTSNMKRHFPCEDSINLMPTPFKNFPPLNVKLHACETVFSLLFKSAAPQENLNTGITVKESSHLHLWVLMNSDRGQKLP
jgi:hypothetical protein